MFVQCHADVTGEHVVKIVLPYGFLVRFSVNFIVNPFTFKCDFVCFKGLPVVLPRETDSVLVGSAILAAFAAGDFGTMKVHTSSNENISIHCVSS